MTSDVTSSDVTRGVLGHAYVIVCVFRDGKAHQRRGEEFKVGGGANRGCGQGGSSCRDGTAVQGLRTLELVHLCQ